MRIDGQCHCGFVTYEAQIDPDEVGICHCTDCQQLTGSAYRVTATAKREDFRLTGGEPKLYAKRGDSGAKSLQFFCPNCGSPCYRTGEGEDAAEIGIRLGTINQRHALTPKRQSWRGSALPWVDEIGRLPRGEDS